MNGTQYNHTLTYNHNIHRTYTLPESLSVRPFQQWITSSL